MSIEIRKNFGFELFYNQLDTVCRKQFRNKVLSQLFPNQNKRGQRGYSSFYNWIYGKSTIPLHFQKPIFFIIKEYDKNILLSEIFDDTINMI